MRRLPRAILACMSLALGASGAAATDDEDVIAYRRHIMHSLQEQTAALGKILSGAVPDDNAVAHMEALALIASTALKSFEPKVPGGDSKPEVWSDWDDFAGRMQEFSRLTAKMAEAGRTEGKDAGLSHAIEALNCKACHDVYRKPRTR
jgi:cytochrome c556